MVWYWWLFLIRSDELPSFTTYFLSFVDNRCNKFPHLFFSFFLIVDISQARPNVQASFMQRMADVLTSMMNRSSQRVTSPSSPVGSPIGSPVGSPVGSLVSEPSFPAHSGDSTNSAPQPIPDRPEIIDCVTYESLWRSETQSENQESNPSQNLVPLSFYVLKLRKTILDFSGYEWSINLDKTDSSTEIEIRNNNLSVCKKFTILSFSNYFCVSCLRGGTH